MADAKDAPAKPQEKPKLPRRCAKCATPRPDAHFKTDAGVSPYCPHCRQRFPELAGRVVSVQRPSARKR
jgi:hypothetical protein